MKTGPSAHRVHHEGIGVFEGLRRQPEGAEREAKEKGKDRGLRKWGYLQIINHAILVGFKP